MATTFPTTLDALSNPTSGSQRTSPSHAGQHTDENDAIEALQTKVGVNASAVAASLDYKIAHGVHAADLAISGDILSTSTGTQQNWAPTGLASAGAISWDGSAIMTLGGLTGGYDGRLILLENRSNAYAIFINNQDAASTATNRFFTPSAIPYVLSPQSSVLLYFSANSNAWKVLAETPVPISVDFSKSGELAVGAGTFRWYNRTGRTRTFDSVSASVGTAPSGGSLILDVNKGGTTIYTTQGNRPAIGTGLNQVDNTAAPNVTSMLDNEYLTIDIDQVGPTTPGSDLTVQVWMR